MEDMAVVFFYVEEGASGRKKVGRKRFGGFKWSEEWQYRVHVERKTLGEGSLTLYCVGLPALEKDKKWTCLSWQQYLQGLPVPPESRFVYYAPDKKAEKMLKRGREPIGIDWILILLEYYKVRFDGLVLVQDREMEAEELIRYFAARISYLGIVKDFMTDWDEVEESLSMEYGLTLDVQQNFGLLHIKGERLLIVLGAGMRISERTELAERSIILSTEGRRRECDTGLFKEKKAVYVDMERFLKDTVLDTVRKIKYNSTR